MENFEKWKKVVLISFIILIITFIVVAITSTSLGILYDVSRIIFFIDLIIYVIGIVECTIIAKKNKEKIKGWLGILQTITLIILVLAVVMFVITTISKSAQDKKMNDVMQTMSTNPSDYGLPDDYYIPTKSEGEDLLRRARENIGQ